MKKGTTFDILITREEALSLIKPDSNGLSISEMFGFSIMCKEYGEDEDWCGVYSEDYDTILSDNTYATFEIWLEGEGEERINELLNNIMV